VLNGAFHLKDIKEDMVGLQKTIDNLNKTIEKVQGSQQPASGEQGEVMQQLNEYKVHRVFNLKD
jgi:peptidoglycan hydrolase CwlO-like protein